MTFKEKPMIEAGSKGAGVPGFFFATPFIAGFFGMIMAAFLGSVCFGVPGALFAGGENRAFIAVVCGGALVAMVIGTIANIYLCIAAVGDADLLSEKLQTLFGGLVATAVVSAALYFGAPYAHAMLEHQSSGTIQLSVLPSHPPR